MSKSALRCQMNVEFDADRELAGQAFRSFEWVCGRR